MVSPHGATSRFDCTHHGQIAKFAWALAITLLTFAAYLPTLRAGFVWDDDAYVTHNPTLRDAGGLWRIWTQPSAAPQYYPLVHSSFWLEWHLWGDRPVGYHAANVALHALVAILLGVVLARLQLPGAWLAAAIFAVHPMHVESVAWITERKNVLSGVFYLAAALAAMRYSGLDGSSATTRSRRWYAATLTLFAGALLSKTTTCMLPIALGLLLWWRHGRIVRRDWSLLTPMLAMSVAAGLLTTYVERYHVLAEGTDWSLSPVGRVLVAGRAVWFYAGKLIWPHSLCFVYPRWQIDPAAAWQYAFPLAVMVLLVGLYLARHRLGRGPLAAAAYFVITLVPALGFLNIYFMRYSFVADHFAYLASMGLIALAAAVTARGFRSAETRYRPAGKPQQVAALLLVGLLGTLTWRQSRGFYDAETLWRDTLAKNPQAWMAWNNLGWTIAQQERYQDALPYYRHSLELRPDNAEACYNLGRALARLDRPAEALPPLQEAVRLRPTYAKAHGEVAGVFARMGKTDEALDHYRQSLAAFNGDAETHNNFGNLLAAMGRLDEAVEHYREAMRIDPALADTYNNCGLAMFQQRRLDQAVGYYRRALQIDPNHAAAHYNLASALVIGGAYADAFEHLQRALQLAPSHAASHKLLGDLLLGRGNTAGAIHAYHRALECQPDWPPACMNLAWILAAAPDDSLRDGNEAVRLAEIAVRASSRTESIRALDVLAAAYAEVGRFADAVRTGEQALQAAQAANIRMVEPISQRLSLYRQQQSFRVAP